MEAILDGIYFTPYSLPVIVAPMPQLTATATPVKAGRIHDVDALRGFALLGIFVVNITFMASASRQPGRRSDLRDSGGCRGPVCRCGVVLDEVLPVVLLLVRLQFCAADRRGGAGRGTVRAADAAEGTRAVRPWSGAHRPAVWRGCPDHLRSGLPCIACHVSSGGSSGAAYGRNHLRPGDTVAHW